MDEENLFPAADDVQDELELPPGLGVAQGPVGGLSLVALLILLSVVEVLGRAPVFW